ncbi:hypothetical protein [Arthrobacter sp. JCM 19049]|nr:hypothetical protein [Arthrobacter sp. JCM 19049]
MFFAIGMMAVGMCLHIGSLVVRSRDVRAWRIANGLQSPKKKK